MQYWMTVESTTQHVSVQAIFGNTMSQLYQINVKYYRSTRGRWAFINSNK